MDGAGARFATGTIAECSFDGTRNSLIWIPDSIIAMFVLPSRPKDAKWLPAAERDWLENKLAEETIVEQSERLPLMKILLSPKILILALVYASTAAISQGLSLWQPQMIKSFGLTDVQVGWINAVPFAAAVIVMLLWSRYSDKTRKRVMSTVIPMCVAAVGLIFIPWAVSLPLFMIVVSIVLMGTYASKGPFWSLSTEWMGKREAVAGVAMVNALGSLAAFGGNWVIGAIHDNTGSFGLSMLPLMILGFVSSAVLIIAARAQGKKTLNV
ncbi:MFS transporter [Glutamicibacter sp. MCAF14]|uniref:MFS transporter n=1 Tax=Glutamicibacter sp. MCAF14 TaxID=3233043 RepID=UPI003F8F4AAE